MNILAVYLKHWLTNFYYCACVVNVKDTTRGAWFKSEHENDNENTKESKEYMFI